MDITAARLELLVIGIQALLWIVLFTTGAFGHSWLCAVMESLKDWEVLITLFVLTACYSIGIVLDRVADYVLGFKEFHKKVTKKCKFLLKFVDIDAEPDRVRILAEEGRANELIGYSRVQLRIIRGTVINTPLITISAAYYVWQKIDVLSKLWPMVIILFVGSCIFVLTLVIYSIIQSIHEKRIEIVKEIQAQKSR